MPFSPPKPSSTPLDLPLLFITLFTFLSHFTNVNPQPIHQPQTLQLPGIDSKGGYLNNGVDLGFRRTRRGVNEVVENSSLVLAEERTHRRDPLDGFRRYAGGWNISDTHYWTHGSSVCFITFVGHTGLVGMLDIQHPMHLIQDLSLPQIWPYHQHPTCMPEPYHGSIARRYSSLTPFDRSGLSAPTQDTPSTPVQNPPSTLQHLPAEPPAPPPPSDAIRRLRDGSKTLSAFAIFVFPVALSLTVAILGLLKPSTTHGHSERPALFYLSVSCRALSVALSLLSTLLYSFVRDIWDETDPRVTTSFQIAAVVCYGSAATLTATLVMVPALFVSHWVAVLTGVIFGSLFVVEMYAFYKGVRHYRYM